VCTGVGGTMVRRVSFVYFYLLCLRGGMMGGRMRSLGIRQVRFGERGCRVDFVASIVDAKVLSKTQRVQRGRRK